MPIKYKPSDLIVEIRNAMLLNQGRRFFAHGANSYATMGAGVAAALASAYPEVAKIDRAWSVPVGPQRLGRSTFAALSASVGVFNLYTQLYPGPDFRLSALASALEEVRDRGVRELTIPRIGAGIGGGDWDAIEPILENSGLAIEVIDWVRPGGRP